MQVSFETRQEGVLANRKLVVLGHCILNMNARAPGISLYPGAMPAILNTIREAGATILQLPCPETSFCGVRRWWQVKEQYDNVNYRRHCRYLAQIMGTLIERYFQSGYSVYLLGLGISPSCGVRMTQSDPKYGGRPYAVPDQASVVQGAGVWIEELVAELERRTVIHHRLDIAPVLIYFSARLPANSSYPTTENAALEELREFLLEP